MISGHPSHRLVRRMGSALASLTVAATILLAPAAQGENAQSPALPQSIPVKQAKVTKQVRENSSKNPIIWVGSSLDVPGINTGFRSFVESNGMSFYEWSPLMTSNADPNIATFDRTDKYVPNLDAYIRKVMRNTHAKKINIVTYSQGGLIAASWMRQGNNAALVDKVANISGLTNGSPVAQLASLPPADCFGIGACKDLNPNGEFIKRTTKPSALPGIEYLNIDSKADVVAGPYTNSFMTGPGDYQNVLTEDLCPLRYSGHMIVSFLPVVHEAIVQFFRGQQVAPGCSLL